MTTPYSREKEVAISAVLKASFLARKVQHELIGSGGVTKKDKSPVTGSSLFRRGERKEN
jgi:3'(2'), 5'-bisphosphate nucleotidase